jgi:hypothetical protein
MLPAPHISSSNPMHNSYPSPCFKGFSNFDAVPLEAANPDSACTIAHSDMIREFSAQSK